MASRPAGAEAHHGQDLRRHRPASRPRTAGQTPNDANTVSLTTQSPAQHAHHQRLRSRGHPTPGHTAGDARDPARRRTGGKPAGRHHEHRPEPPESFQAPAGDTAKQLVNRWSRTEDARGGQHPHRDDQSLDQGGGGGLALSSVHLDGPFPQAAGKISGAQMLEGSQHELAY